MMKKWLVLLSALFLVTCFSGAALCMEKVDSTTGQKIETSDPLKMDKTETQTWVDPSTGIRFEYKPGKLIKKEGTAETWVDPTTGIEFQYRPGVLVREDDMMKKDMMMEKNKMEGGMMKEETMKDDTMKK